MVFDVQGFNYGYGGQGPAHAKHGSKNPQQHYGWADVEGAQAEGASNYQLWQLFDRAKRERAEQQAAGWRGNTPGSTDHRFAISHGGSGFEDRLKELTGGGRPSEPGGHKFGDHGAWGFGMEDIKHVGKDNLDRIKELRDFAELEGIGVGGKVAGHIQELEEQRSRDQRDERHAQTQQELLDRAEEQANQRAAEQREFNDALMAQQNADHAESLRIQTEANDAARLFQEQQAARGRRVQSSTSSNVGNAATIRGSRLSITEAGGRKGARRFSRPELQYMNNLSMQINADPRTINTRAPITI